MNIQLTLTDSQQDVVFASPKDAKGHEVKDALTWTISDAAICTIVPATDGMSCIVVAQSPGVCVLTATDGTLSQAVDITVVDGAPSSLNLSTGVPNEQPPVAPVA